MARAEFIISRQHGLLERLSNIEIKVMESAVCFTVTSETLGHKRAVLIGVKKRKKQGQLLKRRLQ